jgi:hypothetical protein
MRVASRFNTTPYYRDLYIGLWCDDESSNALRIKESILPPDRQEQLEELQRLGLISIGRKGSDVIITLLTINDLLRRL